MHIGPNNKAMATLYNYYVQKSEERGKTTWRKSSLNKGQGTKFEQHVFNMYLYSLELAE